MIKRTYLFVPGTRPDRVRKAVESGTDAVIIDLEDAVGIPDKEKARFCTAEFMEEHKVRTVAVYVRINDLTTPYWREDLQMAIEIHADGIMLPKAEHPAGVRTICEYVVDLLPESKDNQFEIIPLIETAVGLQFSYEIAGSHRQISRLAFGSIDYTLDVGSTLSEQGDELLYARSQIVNSSKAAGIDSPIDAVYPNLANLDGLKEDAARGRGLGFSAKLAVHPSQLSIIKNVYAPTIEEIGKAKEIVKEYEHALTEGKGAIATRSMLVDYPVYKKAKDLLVASKMEVRTDDFT